MQESAAIETAKHILLSGGLILSIGTITGLLAQKIKIPDVAVFLIVGMAIGPEALGLIDIKSDSALNQIILLFGASYILFDGGASLRFEVLKRVWITIVIIATVGVLITAAITGIAAYYVLGVPWIVALLLGATLASTDPATLVPIFRQVRIRDRVAQTVMSESAFNDAMGAIVTFGVLGVAMGTGEFSFTSSALDLLKQSLIGIVAGVGLGYLAALLIAHERLGFLADYAPVVTLVAVIGAYFAADGLQASGFMAVFVFGIMIGNKDSYGFNMEPSESRKLDEYVSTTAFIMRLFIFILVGAQVDFGLKQVRLPKDVIEAALKVVPRKVTLGGHSGRTSLSVPHPDGLFYTLINTGARNYLDPETNTYRPLTMANMAEWAQLAEITDEIDCCSILTLRDVPDETCDIYALKTVFENTSKHTILQPFSFASVKYLFELAVAAVGSKEEFKRRPLITPFVCYNSPLLLADYNAEILLQCAEHKAPISADSLPSMGATSPVTIAGTVLLACVEVLSTTVMAQLLEEGTPILARPLVWGLDMATGRSTHCNIEAILADAASVQVFKEGFQIPAMNYAFGNDSYLPDEEAAIQSAQRGLLLTLAGADVVGAAGRMNVMSAVSPVQLMIDKGMVNIFKHAKKGARVDEETLAWKDIMDTAPGNGQFLDRPHTAKHCREVLRSELFVSEPYDSWKAAGGKDLRNRARDKYLEAKKNLKPLNLSKELKREFTRIVKAADAEMIK